MLGITAVAAVFVSAVFIAVADMLIKRSAASGNFFSTLREPWMLAIYLLYFLQILLAIYIFINKGDLAIYGNLFIIFYSILMVLLGLVVFKEHISMLQAVGIILALVGAVLINSRV